MKTFMILFAYFLASPNSWAFESGDPVDGNQIDEPALSDYVSANRSPGIPVEPSEPSDEDGDSASL